MSWNPNGFFNTFTMILNMVFITFKTVVFVGREDVKPYE
jgi:hypothetical protein